MIIRGRGRGSSGQLASYLGDYLLDNPKNEEATVLEIKGSAFRGLDKTFRSWEAEAIGSRCEKSLWHASLRTPAGENLTNQQWEHAADILEKHLGFQGQPRAIVLHKKDGHTHGHVVWSRIRREDETVTLKNGATKTYRAGTAKRDDFTHKKNTAAAREIEETLGLQHVDTPEFANDDKSKSRQQRREDSAKSASQHDYQRAKRSKLDPQERKQTITRLWNETTTGHEFRDALEQHGYVLAHGKSRGYVVVDKAGDAHSIARQITGAYAADVRGRFADIDPASIPHADHVRQQLRQARKEQEQDAANSSQNRDSQRPKEEPTDAIHPPKTSKFANDNPDEKSLDPAIILTSMTRNQSTFTKSDLLYEIGKRIEKETGEPDQKQKVEIARRVAALPDFLTMGRDRYGKVRYTSRDMLETELDMRDSSDVLARRKGHGVWRKDLDSLPGAKKLGEEQKAAFEHVTGPASLSAVIGYAGSGKSTMLGAAKEAWEAAGYRVKGYALSGMAAQSLQNGSNIESRTLASMFYAVDRLPEQIEKLAGMSRKLDRMPTATFEDRQMRFDMKTRRDQMAKRIKDSQFTSRDVIVLDEAAMVGSRQMGLLLEMAEQAKAKVVLVGDAEQLQSIESGGAFRALAERHGAAKLSTIRRQKEDWAREATRTFGDGFTADGLATYKDKGHIHELNTREGARKQMVEAWKNSREANPNDSHLMMAFTRADVENLNQQGRAAYAAEGRLGIDEEVRTETGWKNFAHGDRLYFLQNDARLQVKNGSLGTVENIERNFPGQSHRITVRLDNAEGKTVTFDTKDYEKFSHGYAATVHRSQGVTTHRSHVLASQFMDRHATYVAMTRHVKQVDMFYATDEFSTFRKLSWSLSRDRRKDTTLDYLGREEKAWPAEIDQRSAEPSRKPPAPEPQPVPMRQTIGELKVTIGERPDQVAAAQEKTREDRVAERVLARMNSEPGEPAKREPTREERIAQRHAEIQQKRKLDILRRRDKDNGNDIAM